MPTLESVAHSKRPALLTKGSNEGKVAGNTLRRVLPAEGTAAEGSTGEGYANGKVAGGGFRRGARPCKGATLLRKRAASIQGSALPTEGSAEGFVARRVPLRERLEGSARGGFHRKGFRPRRVLPAEASIKRKIARGEFYPQDIPPRS